MTQILDACNLLKIYWSSIKYVLCAFPFHGNHLTSRFCIYFCANFSALGSIWIVWLGVKMYCYSSATAYCMVTWIKTSKTLVKLLLFHISLIYTMVCDVLHISRNVVPLIWNKWRHIHFAGSSMLGLLAIGMYTLSSSASVNIAKEGAAKRATPS